MQLGWQRNGVILTEIYIKTHHQTFNSSFTSTEEALPPLGVVVEGPAVVGVLVVALGPAALDVRHLGDVGVGEGQVVPRHVDVLAVGRHCVKISSVKTIFVQSIF